LIFIVTAFQAGWGKATGAPAAPRSDPVERLQLLGERVADHLVTVRRRMHVVGELPGLRVGAGAQG